MGLTLVDDPALDMAAYAFFILMCFKVSSNPSVVLTTACIHFFRNNVGFMISFNVLFGMAFLASSFVVFLVQERTNKAKHVQFVSGVDPVSYWTSAYLWDLINFFVPALTILILVAAFDVPAYTGMLFRFLSYVHPMNVISC